MDLWLRHFIVQPPAIAVPAEFINGGLGTSAPPTGEGHHKEENEGGPNQYIETSVTALVTLVVHADPHGGDSDPLKNINEDVAQRFRT